MTKRRLSSLFILIGVIFIGIAVFICYQNIQIEESAKSASEEALNKIYEEIDDSKDNNEDNINIEETQNEIAVDGNSYMAVITFPTLGLELPVQSTWSYDKLKSSPCLYKSEPMSIAAHNYTSHFGTIKNLEIGDTVTLTYMTGEVEAYEVVLVTKVHETEMEALEDDSYDLSLFTCNYSNNTERILVRLKLV